jgi:peptidoglycan/LPS O-acetylase OafA/YrhL
MSAVIKSIARVDFVEWTIEALAELTPAISILFWPLDVAAIRLLYPVALVLGMFVAGALVELRKVQLRKGNNVTVNLLAALFVRSLYMFGAPTTTDKAMVSVFYLTFVLVDICILAVCRMKMSELNAVEPTVAPAK